MTDHAVAADPAVARWLVERITFYDTAEEVSVATPLAELGLDSVFVMTLCGDIEDTLGVEIDPSFFADFTTIDDLAAGLTEKIGTS